MKLTWRECPATPDKPCFCDCHPEYNGCEKCQDGSLCKTIELLNELMDMPGVWQVE